MFDGRYNCVIPHKTPVIPECFTGVFSEAMVTVFYLWITSNKNSQNVGSMCNVRSMCVADVTCQEVSVCW